MIDYPSDYALTATEEEEVLTPTESSSGDYWQYSVGISLLIYALPAILVLGISGNIISFLVF